MMPEQTVRRHRPHGLRRTWTSLSLAMALSGCASWHVHEGPTEDYAATIRADRVRVTHRDGTQTVLTRPHVLGNVLAGFDADCIERWGHNRSQCPETGVPVFEIEVLEVERRGVSALILPAAGGLLAVWLLVHR